MKKTFIMALTIILAISLCACGSTSAKVSSTAPSSTVASVAPSVASSETSQEFSWAKEIVLITDQAAGSAGDLLTRQYATLFEKYAGVKVLVENTTGSSGVLALTSLLGKDADGYTFFQQSSTMPLTLSTGTAPYSPDDLTPLASISRDTFYLSVAANSPYNSFDELLSYSKKNPGTLNGAGNSTKGVVEYYAQMVASVTGLNFVYVPYASANESKIGVIGGDSDILFLSRNLSKGDVEAGNLKALARTGDNDALDPSIPTFASLGYDDMKNVTFWRGIFCKAGTPEAVQKKFQKIHAQVIADSEWSNFLGGQNLEQFDLSQEDFNQLFHQTYENGLTVFGK